MTIRFLLSVSPLRRQCTHMAAQVAAPRLWKGASVFCAAACCVFSLSFAQSAPPTNSGQGKATSTIPFEGQAEAPAFPDSLEWLNVERPLSLADLRGKVVLLDFWTYCCINCMHIIPDLKKLEAKYAKELVVIGVHSAKFENEKQTDNIREAIKRYEIEHPVVNDRDFLIWRSYRVRSWPTLMLINPNGRVIGMQSGEGIFDLFDQVIGQTVRYFDEKGQIDRKPIRFHLEKEKAPQSVLSYPGKITADEKSNRLFFTDSNHNRVLVASLDGEILECIGDGQAGLTDGSFGTARFFRPQGVCFDSLKDLLYVADTENHAIRQIDLKARAVKTLAGTGRQARRFHQEGKGVDLNSPWDLVLVGEKLYIAMAGPHQLWSLDLKTIEARIHAGSGRENIVDGLLKEAALAQPSGITTDGMKLYFADSEVSAARMADLTEDGRVDTLIGEGLFQFGDVDGKYPKARLQHCLGVAHRDGAIYIADTYNHKIKKLDPKTKELTTFIGTGKRGAADGLAAAAMLNEPSGLCFAADKMFIADANNHLIRVCDLKSGHVSTMAWRGLEKLMPSRETKPALAELLLEPKQISTGTRTLDLQLSFPPGTKLNTAAPSHLRVRSADTSVVDVREPKISITTENVSIPISPKSGKTKLTLELTLYYCDQGNAGLCYFKEAWLGVPIEISEATGSTMKLSYSVRSP